MKIGMPQPTPAFVDQLLVGHDYTIFDGSSTQVCPRKPTNTIRCFEVSQFFGSTGMGGGGLDDGFSFGGGGFPGAHPPLHSCCAFQLRPVLDCPAWEICACIDDCMYNQLSKVLSSWETVVWAVPGVVLDMGVF